MNDVPLTSEADAEVERLVAVFRDTLIECSGYIAKICARRTGQQVAPATADQVRAAVGPATMKVRGSVKYGRCMNGRCKPR